MEGIPFFIVTTQPVDIENMAISHLYINSLNLEYLYFYKLPNVAVSLDFTLSLIWVNRFDEA